MLFNIDEKQLMLELKNKDERALKICMNKYYRYVVYIVENIIGSALPYEDKEVSYYYYTKTIAVIAEETGLKESTVKSKLLRGRKKLKLKMEKKGFRYEDCKIFFE